MSVPTPEKVIELVAAPVTRSSLKIADPLLSEQTTMVAAATSAMAWHLNARFVDVIAEELRVAPLTDSFREVKAVEVDALAAPSIKESLRTAARVLAKPVETEPRELISLE